MKSLFTIIILLTGILTTNLLAQPWNYNFGTATGSFSEASSTSDFLPNPPTDGGSDLVIVGNTGGGFALVDPGSDSELQITAATGTGNFTGEGVVNKFSVSDYTFGTSFSIGFNIEFSCIASDNGVAYFFIGNGAYFTSEDRYVGADLYTGIRWTKGTDDTFLEMEILMLDGSNYESLDPVVNLDINQEYYVEMFGNNTSGELTYDYPASTTQTLSAYSYDLWIDVAITSVDNRLRSSGTIGNGTSIDSYMFLGEGSTTNGGNQLIIIVDDFTYSNTLETGPLPVELAYFAGTLNGNNVELRWRTETEVNNYGFNIERAINDEDNWTTIAFVEGHGNSNSPKQYSFIDTDINLSGEYYYRLKQIDNDGTYEYSDIVSVEVGVPNNFQLSQNYPNPFNPETRIDFTLPEKQLVSLRIYNTLGEMVTELVNEQREAGSYSVTFDASNLPSGVYIYRLQTSSFAANKKMTLLK